MKRARSWFVAALGCIAAVAVIAQTGDAPAPFAEAVDVELVTVDVWVSDRQGRPVSGLQASDFSLQHDGAPVAITHFSEIGAVAAPPAVPAPAGAPPAMPAPAPGEEDAQGHLVLYFDQLHLRPGDYGPLVQAAQQLLDSGSVPPERVMVLRQDRALHLEAPLGSSREAIDVALRRVVDTRGIGDTTDEQQLIAAVAQAWDESEQLSGSATQGLMAAASAANAGAAAGGPRGAVGGSDDEGVSTGSGGSLGPDACDMFVDRVEATVASWVAERNMRTGITLRHLEQTGAILSGLPGVKTLVFMSDALEPEPATAPAAAVSALCPGKSLEFASPEMPTDLLRLTRHFNTNQVTIHSLHATGLRVADSTTAASRGFAGGSRTGRVANAFESASRTSQRRGLGVLADETGGRLVINQNDFGGELQRVARDMGSFYSLAYRPPRGGPGEHRIEVALRDRSLEARYRRGYREKDGNQRMRELLEGALYLGLTSNPLEVRLGAGETRPRGEKFVLPLHVYVPVGKLTYLGPEASPAAELRLQVLARDTGGQGQVNQSKAYRIVRPAGAGGAADLAVELELARGTHVVAIGLRDEASRTISLVSTTLEIGQ